MTGIRSDTDIPVWERKDGAIIIEGRPGICKTCGKHISRYRTQITDNCTDCSFEANTIIEEKIRAMIDEIMAL